MASLDGMLTRCDDGVVRRLVALVRLLSLTISSLLPKLNQRAHGLCTVPLLAQHVITPKCSLHGHEGVNVYSDGGLETFDESTGLVQLEVLCTNTTELMGGRGKQYSVSGPSGAICFNVAILALWVRLKYLPSMVFCHEKLDKRAYRFIR